jgi:hypothetical protein
MGAEFIEELPQRGFIPTVTCDEQAAKPFGFLSGVLINLFQLLAHRRSSRRNCVDAISSAT